MASDLHTHIFRGAREIVSASQIISPYTSLEYHPWQVPENFSSLPEKFCRDAEKAVALGECGLDRLRGAALPVQMRAFEQVCAIAEKEDKFLIIHCVRCDAEIFSILKNFQLNVLFHGFNHAPKRLEFLLEQGAYVSLAPDAWHHEKLAGYLKTCDFSRIGFETDDRDLDIAALIADAEKTLSRDDICASNDAIFDRIVGAGLQKR